MMNPSLGRIDQHVQALKDALLSGGQNTDLSDEELDNLVSMCASAFSLTRRAANWASWDQNSPRNRRKAAGTIA